MIFKGPATVHFGSSKITDVDLKNDRRKWGRVAFLPGMSARDYKDQVLLLRHLLYKDTPIVVSVGSPLVLEAKLIFPRGWRINRRPRVTLRLQLKSGTVKSLLYDNKYPGVNNLVVVPRQMFAATFAGGYSRLEFRYSK